MLRELRGPSDVDDWVREMGDRYDETTAATKMGERQTEEWLAETYGVRLGTSAQMLGLMYLV